MRTLRLLLLALGLPLAAQAPAPSNDVTPKQAALLLGRVEAREAFMDSGEAKTEPQSLYRFFHKPDYLDLRGNPVIGYYSAEKFKWEGNRVAWLGFKSVTADAKPIQPQAWDAAFRLVAKLRGLVIDKDAPIRIQGACVGAVIEPTMDSPYRGVCIEVRITSPTGTMLYRYSVGKPTIEDAIAASLDWVVNYAKAINQPEPAPGSKKAKK